mgnify:CR=1 FL=1|tara:strand:- start:529 stop:996 length:468 start_codon:yes stop_codon:yes gene_type:complete
MSDEIIPLNGHVRIRAWEKQPDGTEIVVKDDTIKNLIVNVGKDSILKYLGNVSGGGYANSIGVGDSTTAAAAADTDLQASSNKLWKTVASDERVYIRPTLYINADFGYSEANFTWNELGIRDSQGTPLLWARQIDSSPLVKTSSKRAIVEWQLSL